MMGPCGSHWQTDLPILTVVHVRQHSLLSCQLTPCGVMHVDGCARVPNSAQLLRLLFC